MSHFISTTSFNWWKPENLCSAVYLGTNREDWLHICQRTAHALEGGTDLLEIGAGDGHTTEQILGRMKRLPRSEILEPDDDAFRTAMSRLPRYGVVAGHCRPAETYFANNERTWDRILAVHSNYYWGKTAEENIGTLDQVVDHCTGKLVILTAPEDSDYYRVLEKNPFPSVAFAEHVAYHLARRGLQVSVERMRQRYYVGDIFDHDGEATHAYNFFTDSYYPPSKKELRRFRKRVASIMQDGWLDFRDHLIVAEKK